MNFSNLEIPPEDDLQAEDSAPLLEPPAGSDKETDIDTDSVQREGGEEPERQKTRAELNAEKWEAEADAKIVQKGFIEPGERGCVDCWCLLILLAFVGAMGYLTAYAYQNGDVNKLTAPLDASNNFCGVGDYKDAPYLYLTDLNDLDVMNIFRSGVCVRSCPETESEPIDCMVNA